MSIWKSCCTFNLYSLHSEDDTHKCVSLMCGINITKLYLMCHNPIRLFTSVWHGFVPHVIFLQRSSLESGIKPSNRQMLLRRRAQYGLPQSNDIKNTFNVPIKYSMATKIGIVKVPKPTHSLFRLSTFGNTELGISITGNIMLYKTPATSLTTKPLFQMQSSDLKHLRMTDTTCNLADEAYQRPHSNLFPR